MVDRGVVRRATGFGVLAMVALALTGCPPPSSTLAPTTPPVPVAWSTIPPPPHLVAGNAECTGGRCSTRALTCPTTTSCYAALQSTGSYDTEHDDRSYLAHWDGRQWSAVPLERPGGDFTQTYDLSCPTADWCLVAGYTAPADDVSGVPVETRRPLLVSWDGRSLTPLAATPTEPGEAMSVSCTSPSWCMIRVSPPGGYGSTIGLWDGARITDTPLPGEALIVGISCGSPTNCAAVSDIRTIVQWDGTRWSPTGTAAPTIQSISCVGSSFCAVLGRGTTVTPLPSLLTKNHPLVGVWAGRAWPAGLNPFVTPDSSAPSDDTSSISCSSPTWCVLPAVSPKTRIWTGTGWFDAPPQATGYRPRVACVPGARWCLLGSDAAADWDVVTAT
jgi:hypothetical protein